MHKGIHVYMNNFTSMPLTLSVLFSFVQERQISEGMYLSTVLCPKVCYCI